MSRVNDIAMIQSNLEQAADWFALLRDGDADKETIANWNDWLKQDKTNRKAWESIASVDQQFSLFSSGDQGQVAVSVLGSRQQQRLSRRNMLRCLVGGAGLGIAGWASYSLTPLPIELARLQADQTTATGEIREIEQISGSRIWLNTTSAINTRRDGSVDQIELLQGEILVATSGKKNNILQVKTNQGLIQPVGTKFVVRRQKDTTFLAVYEGAVDIKTASTEMEYRVKAGEQVVFSDVSIGDIRDADPARKAWVNGVLVAENMTLEQLVKELSRYQRGYIGVAPEVASLRVLGGYPLADTDKALDMLSEVLPIRIHRPLPWWTVIKPSQ